jgi:large subunit ribosomal protein L21
MIAVIKTGGKQYVVKAGDVLNIEKLDAKQGDNVSFGTLLKVEGEKLDIGTPLLSSQVKAEVVEQGRAKKIEVVHYKAKSRYTRRRGHRQPYTKVKITTLT